MRGSNIPDPYETMTTLGRNAWMDPSPRFIGRPDREPGVVGLLIASQLQRAGTSCYWIGLRAARYLRDRPSSDPNAQYRTLLSS